MRTRVTKLYKHNRASAHTVDVWKEYMKMPKWQLVVDLFYTAVRLLKFIQQCKIHNTVIDIF